MKTTINIWVFKAFVAVAALLACSPLATAVEIKEERVRLSRQWMLGARGLAEARQLQFDTGADIFLYFSRRSPPAAKGLCTWWETRAMKAGSLGSFLHNYIQVEIALPGDREAEAIASMFQIADNGPTVYIIQPNQQPRRIHVFNWPGGRPELKTPSDLLEEIKRASSPSYTELR